MAGPSNESGSGFLRARLRSALNTSNDLLSGISSRFSLFSVGSTSSANSDGSSKVQVKESSDNYDFPRQPLVCPDSDNGDNLENQKSPSMKEVLKETFKLENFKDLRPTLGDLINSESSSEPSTLPTNTPESPKNGFRFRLGAINQSIPKKLGDYKALAIRTLSGESAVKGKNDPCTINVECLETDVHHKQNGSEGGVDGASTDLSSRSFPSIHSLHATGPDPYEKLKIRTEVISSGTPSEGICHSTSMDSTDSDPHKKLWIRSGSQTSLQSWASSLSYDSQAEEVNETKEFMRKFVDGIFKSPRTIDSDRKSEYGQYAQTEHGRLWFARCINAKRCCKCVSEETFFSLVQHFSVMLFECAEADDFSPAKSLMNMCFTFFHEATTPDGQNNRKEFLYSYLRQQRLWKSMRFWNAAFFDALQCERSMRPVITREEVENNRLQAVADEIHYQENITFGQLGTFTCNMHAFGLSKEMVNEFLRKQVIIASLREDQVNLLKENVERMFSKHQEWQ